MGSTGGALTYSPKAMFIATGFGFCVSLLSASESFAGTVETSSTPEQVEALVASSSNVALVSTAAEEDSSTCVSSQPEEPTKLGSELVVTDYGDEILNQLYSVN